MSQYRILATAAFGIESAVSQEVKRLGFENIAVENGKIMYDADEAGICRSNLWLRSADRVHILLATYKAETFTELFDGAGEIPWETMVPVDGNVIINAKSVKSKLFSLSDIQSIVKKSVMERLKKTYKKDWFEETGAKYPVLVSIHKDVVEILLDTSGEGLHKRGYRQKGNDAPIKETLAAAILNVSGWRGHIPLIDPLCGTGTIVIEAAMIARNIAPGLGRKFVSETWSFIPAEIWKRERAEAYKAIDYDKEVHLMGSDIDAKSIEIARENAEKAGVEEDCTFTVKDAENLQTDLQGGFIITNPPYGERLGEKDEVESLYRLMGHAFEALPTWNKVIITSYETFEKQYGRKADKNRKLYNGRIKCYLYQYQGKKVAK